MLDTDNQLVCGLDEIEHIWYNNEIYEYKRNVCSFVEIQRKEIYNVGSNEKLSFCQIQNIHCFT